MRLLIQNTDFAHERGENNTTGIAGHSHSHHLH